MDEGLLLEEDEPVEGGEEDDGQKHVGEIPRRGNHELGQAPQVHCHLTRPAAPPTRNVFTLAKNVSSLQCTIFPDTARKLANSVQGSRVSPFRLKNFFAYKRNKANLDPFHLCFTISL